MRIEAYNQIAKVYEANQTAGKAKTTKAAQDAMKYRFLHSDAIIRLQSRRWQKLPISGKRRLRRLQRR